MRRSEVKAGDEKREGKYLLIWVICPDCEIGRWVRASIVKQIRFTGRCKACYHKIAKQEMGLYYQGG